MKQIQQKSIFYNFYLNQQKPLDARVKIDTLTDLQPLGIRYPGLIFFVVDQNTPYIFLNDLDVPVKLFDVVNANNIFGLNVEDYTNLNNDLMETAPGVGSLITIYPLGVTFIFTGTDWLYHSGDYIVDNTEQFETIPTNLRKVGALVLLDVFKSRCIISNDLTIDQEVITLSQFPTNFQNNRYYRVGSVLYYTINSVFYKIGEQNKLFVNQTLGIGKTNIVHGLDSAYISVLFWINNTTTVLRLTEYDIINNDEIQLKSSTVVQGTMILTTTY